MNKTIGVLEAKGYSAVLSAAEKILENKNIQLLKIEKTGGGIVSSFFEGDFEEITSAFDDGIKHARLIGEIVSVYILSKSRKDIEKFIFGDKIISKENQNESAIVKTKSIAKAARKSKNKNAAKPEEETVTVIEDQPVKIKSSISTIQRLRNEALAADNSAKVGKSKIQKRKSKLKGIINLNKIDGMNVHELRQLARKTKDFPIRGREVSKANRKELISYFKEIE